MGHGSNARAGFCTPCQEPCNHLRAELLATEVLVFDIAELCESSEGSSMVRRSVTGQGHPETVQVLVDDDLREIMEERARLLRQAEQSIHEAISEQRDTMYEWR